MQREAGAAAVGAQPRPSGAAALLRREPERAASAAARRGGGAGQDRLWNPLASVFGLPVKAR